MIPILLVRYWWPIISGTILDDLNPICWVLKQTAILHQCLRKLWSIILLRQGRLGREMGARILLSHCLCGVSLNTDLIYGLQFQLRSYMNQEFFLYCYLFIFACIRFKCDVLWWPVYAKYTQWFIINLTWVILNIPVRLLILLWGICESIRLHPGVSVCPMVGMWWVLGLFHSLLAQP